MHRYCWYLVSCIWHKRFKTGFFVFLYELLPCILTELSFLSCNVFFMFDASHTFVEVEKWNNRVLPFIVVVVVIVGKMRFFIWIMLKVQYLLLEVNPFFFPVTLMIWEFIEDLVSKSMVLYFNLTTSSISSISCFFFGFFFFHLGFFFSSSSSSGAISYPSSSKDMGIPFMLSSSIFSFNFFSRYFI